MKHIKKYIPVVIILIVVVFSFLYKPKETDIIDDYSNPTPEVNESIFIFIDIKGEVHHPGVYKVNSETRLYQVVELAGGFTEFANSNNINLSVLLKDQDVIYIPSINDVIDEPTIPIENPNDDLININKATQAELETLPGIGPSTALKIIEYRDTVTSFDVIEDIMNVSGIGESTFDKIKDLITV